MTLNYYIIILLVLFLFSNLLFDILIGFDDLNPKLIEVLNNLYRENIATNLMLNRVMVKVEGIEANLKNKNLNTDSTIYLDTEFLTLFPINSTNGFNLIENQIQNSSDFVSKLVRYLLIYNYI